MERAQRHDRYALILLALFLVFWVALAIRPWDRKDWMLENALAVVAVVVLVLSARRLPLSRISYTLIFVFMCFHEIGAHYTYAEVPYESFFQSTFGFSFNGLWGWQRNNFDRIVHFSYGLLLAYPIREVFYRVVHVKGFWGYFLPLDVTMSTSMVFELIEWGAATAFGGDLGQAYLGTQGDIWDAHKDMALASLGAFVCMAVTAGINLYLQRDLAQEWAESFRVKVKHPLGEDEIGRLLKDRRRSND
jgi:putative membrane protein